MEQKTVNQERGRKYGGSSSFVDSGAPSKAPRQDEDGRDVVGSSQRNIQHADGSSPNQGISNRPANEEHAFPDADPTIEPAAPESIETDSKQVGGNRGRV